MECVKNLFGGCIQARKRRKPQPKYHDEWPPTHAPCTHHHSPAASSPQSTSTELEVLPTEPKRVTKTSSIRIVESEHDEENTDGPERRLRLSRFSDDSTAVGDDSFHSLSEDLDAGVYPTHTRSSHALTAEMRPRIIEDIPEEDEDGNVGDQDAPQDGQMRDAAMAEGEDEEVTQKTREKTARRKSLVEVFHMLQSAGTASKLSNIKLPGPVIPGKSPLRTRPASTSLPSLASSVSTAATPEDTDSDDEVKKQRRVGAIVFPAAMRLRGSDNRRKKRPETMTDDLTTGKEKTLFR
ncbi:hypothetical protein BDV59DRAFT_199205 [Aspergillus ambiguus]|uniref:uncharacterized protein n=1 Tax=Aspergillus ambiguus TaxID=176160 RepID=UPI003CCD2CEE